MNKKKIRYSIADVKELIANGPVVLIDGGDAESFEVEHLPGAVNVPEIATYLADSSPEGLANMQDTFKDIFAGRGISTDKTAIIYEDGGDIQCRSTCRGYWLLTYLGHPSAGILESGLVAWAKEGLPMESGTACHVPAEFIVRPIPEMMASKEDVLKAIEDPSVVLLDNRDRAEWQGSAASPKGVVPVPRAGRIPTARWIEWYDFIDMSARYLTFKPKETIHAICAAQGIYPDDDIIIYCFKGRRAANSYVALKEAGFKKIRIYFASWNEWARHPELPVDERVLDAQSAHLN
jgi:thiosulfate/3-mercaptopyruvate sulfurtransferase